ncbi:hypothetical protein [Glycomyces buryatensis]|uniref:Uncharacterized protein n=1 Tax=Glycomyces buryatensis TaxID=2570927 RepID=A0A4S8Q783_9ACTN|nr:hypothetical protein [Glycomyces buryatensis]THV40088.1 hypothetical protein FAB82_16310 [Glycomyces buryatensis]
MTAEPGQVYRRIERPESLVVVLSNAASNRTTGWATVCLYSLTDQVGNLPESAIVHSLTPSPGYVNWTMHWTVPVGALTGPVGAVEAGPIHAARVGMEARFQDR